MKYSNDQTLDLFYPGISNVPLARQIAWEKFFDDAKVAAENLDLSILREWGKRSLAIAVHSTISRANVLKNLVQAAAKGAWEEFKLFFSALIKRELTDYLKNVCRRLWNSLKATWDKIAVAVKGVKTFGASLSGASQSELIDYTVSFIGGILGFVLIGGTGDGGVIDLDIAALGIGGHRSIWFHSALVGLAAEICFLSFFELAQLLHERLPQNHSPIWDRMLGIGQRFSHALITGSWAGVATHLAVDSHIDGWTPYKDLPVIGLPQWGHHLIMDLNAASAGWFGWQFHDKAKRHFRDNGIVCAKSEGRELPLLD